MANELVAVIKTLTAQILAKEAPGIWSVGDTKIIITLDQISFWRNAKYLGQSTANDFIAYQTDPIHFADDLATLARHLLEFN